MFGFLEVVALIKQTIQATFPDVNVDVADHQTLKQRIRENAEAEALYVF